MSLLDIFKKKKDEPHKADKETQEIVDEIGTPLDPNMFDAWKHEIEKRKKELD